MQSEGRQPSRPLKQLFDEAQNVPQLPRPGEIDIITAGFPW